MNVQNGLTLEVWDARNELTPMLEQQIARFVDQRVHTVEQKAQLVSAMKDFLSTTKLAPALHGEPIFVLRAADKIAPSLVLAWANDASRHDVPLAKSGGAQKIAYDMLAWQMANPASVKVPD
jgi:hypothetical protein